MSKPSNRYRPTDPLSVAEAVFRPVIPRAAETPREPRSTPLPVGKEQISIRIDRDVLDHFQEEGPGWQDRINDALRKAAGL
jgi:uncharacterized protein (DUF4415 family)